MQLAATRAGNFTAEKSNKVPLAVENTLFLTDKSCWNVSGQSGRPATFSERSLAPSESALTLVGVAALYVSGDTDHSQGVDAGQAKEQREEAIHLEGQRMQLVSRAPRHPQIPAVVCLAAAVSFSPSQIPAPLR